MKTNTEILATWETEGIHADWCAIDSYDPMTGETTRLFVGTEDDCTDMMKAYYISPNELAMQPFHRCSYIANEDAKAFFEGISAELHERGVYSISEAAEMLDVSRQRVHAMLKGGQLDGLKVGNTWSVYRESIESRIESRRKPFERYELDAYLGDFADDFDIDAIIDEATDVDPRTGNRYWREGIDLAEICAKYDRS